MRKKMKEKVNLLRAKRKTKIRRIEERKRRRREGDTILQPSRVVTRRIKRTKTRMSLK